MLDFDWLHPYTIPDRNNDTLAIDCDFAELLHSILRIQYSPNVLGKSTSAVDGRHGLRNSSQLVKKWLSRLPSHVTEVINNPEIIHNIEDGRKRHHALHVFSQYHRAIFFIHCPWIAPLMKENENQSELALDIMGNIAQMEQRCMEECLQSAFSVIKMANGVFLCETALERYQIYSNPNPV